MTMQMHDSRIGSITGAAGAGFRLSLVLNAVKMKMGSADTEIIKISKSISDFSLMLKQVGKAMEEGEVIASPLAIDTVFDIQEHSERVFDEIKSMTELAQVRDKDGHLTEIGIGQKVTWCFKKQKVPYLLGQLDYLKLNLAIMLQILQLGKTLGSTRSRPTEKLIMQERAEIQNMIVLQHWSFEELRTLYGMANDEATSQCSTSSSPEDPPPRYDDPASDNVHLAIPAPPRPPKEENTSKAIIQYHEQPLQQLDESLHHALAKENSTLSASVPDIVNHLLHAWTHAQSPNQPRHSSYPVSRALTHRRPALKSRKYSAHISDDEEDTTESEYEDLDEHPGGYFLEGPRTDGMKKNVRFKHQQARVEDDTDEELHRPKRPSRKHIINSDEYSSDPSEGPPLHRSHKRHDSNSSGSHIELPSHTAYDRNRRPYTSGPSGPRNSPPEKEVVQPGSSHGRPPSGMQPRVIPMHMPNQPWQGQGPNSPGLRPPSRFNAPPGATPRRSSGGPYVPQPYLSSPGASPVATQGAYFPQRPLGPGLPPPGQGPPPGMNQSRPPSRPKSNQGSRQGSDKAEKDRKSSSRNIKKGIGLGAAAAGLMELISGLDAI